MAKDHKNDSGSNNQDLKDILNDIPKSEDSEETTPEIKEAESEDHKNDSGSKEQPSAKRWLITLVESRSYTHPKAKKPFLKDKPLETADEALAEECKNNSYFKVQEI